MVNSWLQAFVLHRRAYRETSYLVDVFTAQQGKVTVVAKGVRNSKSERKSLLQPFQPVNVQLTGKSELKNLTHIDADGPQIPLRGTELFCGMYLNELLNRVLPVGLACESLFAFYRQTLDELRDSDDIEVILRRFEFELLQEMGVMAELSFEGESGLPVEPQRYYHFSAEFGVLPSTESRRPDRIPGSALLDLSAGHWNPASKRAAKSINRAALQPLLGNKPLKSRDLFLAGRR
ncbi:DNA repair protein RecO [Alteromonas aestuariivivens]|uniref:DNA repair protein RecO n=1 Tax=Alteromonas aestuariivivens TaxID=1938339 RepID=A0A3D8MCJ2_9ALTE|nr:DNA repair protein RecO [Alteromonas aestuariivivens]